MVKGIFFDVGQVLVSIESPIEQALRVFEPGDKAEFWALLNERALPLCRGEITMPQLWSRLAKELNKEIDQKVLNALWLDGYEESVSLIEDNLNLARRLCSHYKVGIISNTIEEHAEVHRKQKVYDGFDPVVLSHEVRLSKDNPEIFRLALERMKMKAEEALFIDDVPRYVDVARSVGLHGLVYKDCASLRHDLEGLGIPGW